MGNLILKDSRTTKAKTLVMPTPQDDITLIAPNRSGILATTNTLSRTLDLGDDALISNILKPDITENNGGITNPDDHNEPLQRASYKTTEAFKGLLTHTEWIASDTLEFTNILDTTKRPEFKDSWLPNIATPNTYVYVKYRFYSGKLRSPYSNPLRYKTPAYGVFPFTITVTPNTLSPVITTSGFRQYGENIIGNINHIATTYKIFRDDDLVFSSIFNTNDKVSIQVPNGILRSDTTYTVEVTYHTDNRQFPTSKVMSMTFSTPNIYISTPNIMYHYNGGNHTIEGNAFNIVGSSETHTSTYWLLVRIENGNKVEVYKNEHDATNLTILPITDYLVGKDLTYEVTVAYNTATLSSNKQTITFKPVDDLGDPLTITIAEGPDKLPILNYSKYHIEDKEDTVKTTILRVHDLTFDQERVNKTDDTFNGKYNVPMTRTLTADEYRTWFSPSNTKIPEFQLESYIVGNMYNSPLAKVKFKPNLSITADVDITINSHTDIRLQLKNVDKHNANWINISGYKWILEGGHFLTPFELLDTTTLSTTIDSSVNIQYGLNYILVCKAKTDIGMVELVKKTFNIYKGKIAKPTITVRHDIEGITQPRLLVSGSNYVYDKLEVPGHEYKETLITVKKDDEVIATVTSNKAPGTEIPIAKSKYDKLDWNARYTITLQYVAENEVVSEVSEVEYNLPIKPSIAISTPTLTASISGKRVELQASGFNIVGVEDKRHIATNWYLYENSTLIWSSLTNTNDLTEIVIPEIVLTLGHNYIAKCSFIGINNTTSEQANKAITL